MFKQIYGKKQYIENRACLIGVRVGARADSQNAAFHTIEDKESSEQIKFSLDMFRSRYSFLKANQSNVSKVMQRKAMLNKQTNAQ